MQHLRHVLRQSICLEVQAPLYLMPFLLLMKKQIVRPTKSLHTTRIGTLVQFVRFGVVLLTSLFMTMAIRFVIKGPFAEGACVFRM